MKNHLFLILLLTFGCSTIVVGQNKKVVQDSIRQDSTIHYKQMPQKHAAGDSTDLYKKINKYAQKSKLGRLLSDWIFKDSTRTPQKTTKTFPRYAQYAGKIIRKIKIETKDPFGYSLLDTTKTPHSWFQKAGNAIHIKSQKMAIDKFLLFKKEEPLDTFLIHESARLLRDQNYIHVVKIIPQNVAGTDSVDITVKVLDSWSLLPRGDLSSSHMSIGALERNFIGMGHQMRLKYSKRFSDGNNGYDVHYIVPNFRNTFININLNYSRGFDHYHNKYVSVNRQFYSTLTRWAGGVFFQDRSLKRPMPGDTTNFKERDFQFFYQDYWVGHAFPLSGNNADENSHATNLVLALRAFFLNYKESPSLKYDPINYFSNKQFYLASIGLNSRRYIRDRYIFRNGEIEDVPVGSIYALTAGVQEKKDQTRLYLGLRTTYGTYFKWGFISGNFEIGSFFNHGDTEQTTLSLKVNYFSDLLDLGRGWKIRQFIKPQVVLGYDRKNSIADRLSLNERAYFKGINSAEYIDYNDKNANVNYKTGSIRGFESKATGTKKYVLDLQTQFYSPWSLWGFHLNPFLNLSFGYLAGEQSGFGSNKLYSAFSLGFIIQNDYLVFNSFQFSFSYYPSMPGEGYNIFKSNAVRNEDYGFQNFEATKPRPVIYE